MVLSRAPDHLIFGYNLKMQNFFLFRICRATCTCGWLCGRGWPAWRCPRPPSLDGDSSASRLTGQKKAFYAFYIIHAHFWFRVASDRRVVGSKIFWSEAANMCEKAIDAPVHMLISALRQTDSHFSPLFIYIIRRGGKQGIKSYLRFCLYT